MDIVWPCNTLSTLCVRLAATSQWHWSMGGSDLIFVNPPSIHAFILSMAWWTPRACTFAIAPSNAVAFVCGEALEEWMSNLE